MNQDSPGISPELPKSHPIESQPIQEGVEAKNALTPEKTAESPPRTERLSAANSAVSQAATDDSNVQDPSSVKDDNSKTKIDNNQQSASSLVADDVDIIEKEWVQKAKAIVDETKDDPHKQSSGLSHVKTDYLKKRFNKDVKSSNV